MNRIGVYVDSENIIRCGGYSLRYDILRKFATRRPGDEIRFLNVYMAVDQERMNTDLAYRENLGGYQQTLRDFGWRIIEKPVRWFTNEDGSRSSKANADLDMAVDIMVQSEQLDEILLVSGDGDFVSLVKALQNRGKRVEALGFQYIAKELRLSVDKFHSGFLIPRLLPIARRQDEHSWGQIGSRVRGICNHWDTQRNYGFVRFLKQPESYKTWIVDPREPDSPYASAFLHASSLPAGFRTDDLPNQHIILEFDLSQAPNRDGDLQAKNCEFVYRTDWPDWKPRLPLKSSMEHTTETITEEPLPTESIQEKSMLTETITDTSTETA